MTAFLLIPAFLLDAIWGEPKSLWERLPHPAVLMGRLVGFLDERLNTGTNKRLKGVVAVAALLVIGLLIGLFLQLLGALVGVVVAAILLAHKSLIEHVNAVADGLRRGPEHGRQAVALIVSRDTKDMTTPQIARSAIESAAENFSDGVVAPAFWFLIAGLPGLLIYKLVNTADSMIGYRNERYSEFGWAAARLDDLLNLAPARLSAVLIALVSGQWRRGNEVATDAALHRSPNAGWPEAAMARALNVALAGPRSYDGETQAFAWVNAEGSKSANAHAIERACGVLWKAWAVLLVLLVALCLLVSLG